MSVISKKMLCQKIISCLLVFISFFVIENVLAICVTTSYRCNSAADDFIVHPNKVVETVNGKKYTTYILQRQYSEKYVYCLVKGASAPHVGYGKDLESKDFCTVDNFVGEKVRAAIGYVINTTYSYAEKQHVIHKLMKEAGYGNEPVIYNTTLYNSAKSIMDSYDAIPTVTLGDFSLEDNNYVASYSITGAEGLDSPSISVNVGSISNGKVYIPTNTTTSNGNVDVAISVSYSKTYSLAITKKCGNYQPIAEQDTTSKTKSYSDSDSKTISITGGLKVTKTNSNNDALAQLDSTTIVKFKLYNNSTCIGDSLKDFAAGDTITGLTPRTYYLKEYQAKNGYHLPQEGEKWYCESVTVTAGETKEIAVVNQTECENKFNADMTMKERIDLYNNLKSAYSQNFNALLNMNNTTAQTACKNIAESKSYTTSCLSANSINSSNISETDVSMYTEKYGTYTFCSTSYKLENKLGKSTFDNIKTGQSIINTKDVVAVGTLNRVCYNFGDDESVIPDLNSDSYIEKDVSIDFVDLLKKEILSGEKTNQILETQYFLPLMYASNKDGKVYYGYCPSSEYCKELGSGIISKFNLTPGTYDMKFSIELKQDKFGSLGNSSDCKYTVENELIDYNNKLNLEYRIVKTDSSTAFLSKDGIENRKIGLNWSSVEVQKEVLDNRNDSYNKTGEGAKYTLTLIPSDIKIIREYNKLTSYDDYTLNCESGGVNCYSRFLNSIKNGVLEFYNLTTNEIEKSWTLKNKLIVKEDVN